MRIAGFGFTEQSRFSPFGAWVIGVCRLFDAWCLRFGACWRCGRGGRQFEQSHFSRLERHGHVAADVDDCRIGLQLLAICVQGHGLCRQSPLDRAARAGGENGDPFSRDVERDGLIDNQRRAGQHRRRNQRRCDDDQTQSQNRHYVRKNGDTSPFPARPMQGLATGGKWGGVPIFAPVLPREKQGTPRPRESLRQRARERHISWCSPARAAARRSPGCRRR